MSSEIFKIIPIAYNSKSKMDNSILWDNKIFGGSSLIMKKMEFDENNKIKEISNYKELDFENTDLNTEYFKLSGQYLIMSQSPIPKNSNAYMEIEIYSHPKLSDIRHLGISIGVHANPIHGILIDNFCLGNVYYTKPYNYTNEFSTSDNKVLYGSSEYLSYIVTENYGLNIIKTYQYKPDSNEEITISPPLVYNTIGLSVNMKKNELIIYVNGKKLYSFSPTKFNLNDDDNDSTDDLKKINTSSFYFAMYTSFTGSEIEGLFNLGKNNIKYLNQINSGSEQYSTLFDLYNLKYITLKTNTIIINSDAHEIQNRDSTAEDNSYTPNIDISGRIQNTENTFETKDNKRNIFFKHNNSIFNYIYINTITNEVSLTKPNNLDNIEKKYFGRQFYIEKESDNQIDDIAIQNTSAFNFYNRYYSYFKTSEISDLSIIEFPIPKEIEIYFEFKCMYAYINSEYEGLPLYIGFTDSFTNEIEINEYCYFKIALFRKKTKEESVNTGFQTICKYNDSINIGTLSLINPMIIEQGKSIGIRINLENRLVTIYNRDYEFAYTEIPKELNFDKYIKCIENDNNKYRYIVKQCYFFFQIEDKNVLKQYANSGYIICNFGEDKNLPLINDELLNGENIVSLYDYYNTFIESTYSKTGELSYNHSQNLLYITFNVEINQDNIKNYISSFILSFEIKSEIKNINKVDLNTLFNSNNIIEHDASIYNNYPDKSILSLKELIDKDDNVR